MNYIRVALCLMISVICSGAQAAAEDFVGDWMLEVREGRALLRGVLSIREQNGELVGFVENGPIQLQVEGDEISMVVDDWGRAGGRIERHFRGELSGMSITGAYGPDFELSEEDAYICLVSAANCTYPSGSWTATPFAEIPSSSVAGPIDLVGNWRAANEGLRRWTKDVTASGQEWLDEFDVRMDLPRQRCVHYSLWGHMMYWGSMEVLAGVDANTLTWIVGDAVRRIYFDDRVPSDDTDGKPMGFSTGHWEGNTLVVNTSYLLPSVMGFNGNPMSGNSIIEERFTAIDEDTLSVTMTLIDPENYNQPSVYRRIMTRAEPSERVSMWSACDPDSFYREMYLDGRLPAYWERSDKRF